MNKKLGLIGLGIVVILAVGYWLIKPINQIQSPTQVTASPSPPSTRFADRQKITIQLATHSATVEVVNSTASITQGLSGRSQIGSDGMLFIMPTTRIQTFWMKDMKFDLDMIWLRENRIVDISYNVPKPTPGTPDSQLPLIRPKESADMVLEVVAGQAQTWGVKIGDQLVLPPGR